MARPVWKLVVATGLGACAAPGCLRPWTVNLPSESLKRSAEIGTVAGKAGASESPYHSTDFHADPSLVGGKEEDIQKTGHTSEQEKQASDAGKDQGSSAELEPLKPPAVISLGPPAPPEAPLVAALRALLEKRPAEAMDYLKGYDKVNQEMLLCLLPLAARLAEGGVQQAPAGEVTAILAQLRGLERPLAERAALGIDKICLCRKIEGYGVYEKTPDDWAFAAGVNEQAGELVQVYVELRDFACRQQGQGYETCLASTLEIHDYRGNLVWRRDFPPQPDRSHSPRHDYFINYRFCVPPHVPPGSYVLWVQVKDLTGQPGKDAPASRTARASVDFRVRANGTARVSWGEPGVALKSGEADHDHGRQGDGARP
jgi:hypothetical protein